MRFGINITIEHGAGSQVASNTGFKDWMVRP